MTLIDQNINLKKKSQKPLILKIIFSTRPSIWSWTTEREERMNKKSIYLFCTFVTVAFISILHLRFTQTDPMVIENSSSFHCRIEIDDELGWKWKCFWGFSNDDTLRWWSKRTFVKVDGMCKKRWKKRKFVRCNIDFYVFLGCGILLGLKELNVRRWSKSWIFRI